ncbi:uncharacterized protein G2W53_022381 [Senna tora]|uniref:Uncharacterized protein n=1 Tax=Senna tora TaxID=362788 RepID=A0A834TMK4_9FABA|nr:uncharacterized protein G2W53_022381 [Senna tora]
MRKDNKNKEATGAEKQERHKAKAKKTQKGVEYNPRN